MFKIIVLALLFAILFYVHSAHAEICTTYCYPDGTGGQYCTTTCI